jgi:hypothetical protein
MIHLCLPKGKWFEEVRLASLNYCMPSSIGKPDFLPKLLKLSYLPFFNVSVDVMPGFS